MAISFSTMPSPSAVFGAYASLSAFIMLIQTMLNQLVPRQAQIYLLDIIQYYLKPKSNKTTIIIIIDEKDGLSTNEIYNAAEIYLCTKIRHNVDRLKITKRHKKPTVNIKFAQCQTIPDSFQGVHLEWKYVREVKDKSPVVVTEETHDIISNPEKHCFELSFHNIHKDLILDTYVPFILGKAKSLKAENKVVKLHTLSAPASYNGRWNSINLDHPATFDTLAMDSALKRDIMEDLDRFLRRKEFYRKVGRAWKRGYSLYGPPGTGKSSLIAAIANYLKFDIYDLELTNVQRDSDLRKLLLGTGNRSILVIEDIDCSVELPDRTKPKITPVHQARGGYFNNQNDHQLTLSGLLNFIDGLWSSCGDERIIVFTTNNKDKLDPALLRPGRMDMHIHMSYLTMDGFKLLTSTYLGIESDQHPLFEEIEELVGVVKVTPAQVAEELMQSDDADISLQGLVNFLKVKKNAEINSALMDKQVNDAESDDVEQDIEVDTD